MPQILGLRHSKAIANEQGILMGSSLAMNSPLSVTGIELAKTKGIFLRQAHFVPDRLYCSELMRAQQTAQIILDELGIELELKSLAGLNERDFGQYDGQPYKYVIKAFEDYDENPPTVEPTDKFVERVVDAFEHIRSETTGITLIISHSNPIMVMRTYIDNPQNLQHFWKLGDPEYCEGFSYNF